MAYGPFRPEPVLPDTQYGQALEVLRNARNALERTASMTAHLNEEMIRFLLLAFLNAQFEGAAAGEVFNGAGKTDILIRAGDRNVFIAALDSHGHTKGMTGLPAEAAGQPAAGSVKPTCPAQGPARTPSLPLGLLLLLDSSGKGRQ